MIFKILVALTLSVKAHQYVDDEDPDAYLTNREVGLEADSLDDNYPTKIDSYDIVHGFSNQGSGLFKKRANLIVTRKEKTGEITNVAIDEANKLPEGVDGSSFNTSCDANGLYQIQVPKLDLFASMPSCYYVKTSGLNDTISFQTDFKAQNIVGVQIEYKDIKHAASFVKNPKKKRLMQERQFDVFASTSVLSKVIQGSKPEFDLFAYDA